MTNKTEAQRLADAPERIWLQVCDDADCVESFAAHDGVTWCQDKINDTDIEYVRAERIAELEAALEQARVAMEALRSVDVHSALTEEDADAINAKLDAALIKIGEVKR